MSVRTDALAILRYVERIPGRSCSDEGLAAEFALRGYDQIRFARALAACLRKGHLVSVPERDGVEVP